TMQKQARSSEVPNLDGIPGVISAIDKAAKRGIIHRNAANRRKARLNKALAAASAK
ncbi:MAG: 30S ribosomal protein S20, partial [Verrucomicrobia bacterium]